MYRGNQRSFVKVGIPRVRVRDFDLGKVIQNFLLTVIPPILVLLFSNVLGLLGSSHPPW